MSITNFQQDFTRALLGGQRDAVPQLQAQRAFAVYRNTVMKGCIDALEANYPSVTRLVGRDWFRSAAVLYVEAQPPTDGALLDYGREFPDFLRRFGPAPELPYLPDVARLDRYWRESHAAADAPVLNATQLASLAPEALMQSRLAPHPAARWAFFDEQPIFTIWSRNRPASPAPGDEGDEIAWHSEGALLTRPQSAVRWQAASPADCAFMDACAKGCCLADATGCALDAAPDTDLMALLARLLGAGALASHPPFETSGAHA